MPYDQRISDCMTLNSTTINSGLYGVIFTLVYTFMRNKVHQ